MPATSCSAAARRCAPPTPTRPSSNAIAPISKPATPTGAARPRPRPRASTGKTFVLIRQAGESGQLYGSVTPRDIAEAATATGVKVERGHVHLDAPIKTIGLYTVSVIPHPEVEVKVTVNVARSADEADAQARGEDLTGPVSDRAEIRAAAEALFEQEAEAQDNA